MNKTATYLRRVSASALAAALLLPNSDAAAQAIDCQNAADFPCGFQLEELRLQPVPNVFKFQSRVSQAKLPIGEGLFNTVIVNLKRGTQTLCSEEFSGVRVVDSVLNLEIGRNMTCELDQVIAENNDLAFQICLGGPQNCLRPVALGTTPYATKASFASQSQEAHSADVAGQAHYAHRVTADRDLFVTKKVGTGYIDFYTPASAPRLYDAADFAEYAKGGFLQWTPVDEANPTLHISAKDQVADTPVTLSKLVLYSGQTRMTGHATIAETLLVRGSATVEDDTRVIGELKVERNATTGKDGAHITGDSTINGTLQVTDRLTVESGGAHVTGDTVIDGALDVTRPSLFRQDLQIRQNLGVGFTLNVGGQASFQSHASVAGNLSVGLEGQFHRLVVQNGGFVVNSGSSLGGHVAMNGFLVRGLGAPALADDAATKGYVDTAIALGQGAVNGDLTVNNGGVFAPQGGITVGANAIVGGALEVTQASTFAGDLRTNRNLAVGFTLTVGGEADFQSHVDILGNLSIGATGAMHRAVVGAGGLSVSGASSLAGNVDMNGFTLRGLAAPTAANDAATKGYVDSTRTSYVGEIMLFGHATVPPSGFFECDGRGVPLDSFQELFDVIGYTYGGAGQFFNLPNLPPLNGATYYIAASGVAPF